MKKYRYFHQMLKIYIIVFLTSLCLLTCKKTQNISPDIPIHFLEPLGGETISSEQYLKIRIEYEQGSVNTLNVKYSLDTGKTYSFISALPTKTIQETRVIESYLWLPSQDSVRNCTLLLCAYDYDSPNKKTVLPKLIKIQ